MGQSTKERSQTCLICGGACTEAYCADCLQHAKQSHPVEICPFCGAKAITVDGFWWFCLGCLEDFSIVNL